ncbi:spinster family MFS transporter [Sandarakinorhabdus limnophila]|uniref:spinster family MFS transporter n=1 Tax=Sandarakinorhabdus limnophila TaxID=210512 RepID=UPI0026EB3E23|nr:MFS transporter [Sandarakinorhabdus limnophila]
MMMEKPQGAPHPRLLLWTLLVVYIFNFIDRQIVAILAEPISRDLQLSDSQLGLLTGLAFALFYATLGVPIARVADNGRSNRSRMIAVFVAVWSVMTALCGVAQNFWQLLLARIGVGVGEAGCTPTAHALIADSLPPEKRAGGIAFFGLGIPIGGLLGTLIGGGMAEALGWREAFWVVGIPGLLLALFVWFFLKDPRLGRAAPADAPPRLSMWASLKLLATSPAYCLVLSGASLVAFLSYGKGVWVLVYFQRTHKLSVGQTAIWVGVILGIAGIVGTWLGGWAADKFGSKDRRHMLTLPAWAMVLAAPVLFAGYMVDDWRLAIALLVLPTIANSAYYGPAYGAAQVLARPDTRAMAAAWMVFAQNLIGLGLGPLLFGALSDMLKPEYGTQSVRIVLYFAAWAGLVPALLFWLGARALGREANQKEAMNASVAHAG